MPFTQDEHSPDSANAGNAQRQENKNFFDEFCFADGTLLGPSSSARLKVNPEDFVVHEQMSFDCDGQGEHVWLHITKQQMHTEQLAKQLAQLAGVKLRDVSYSGMKDHQALTSQWFSVWLPKQPVVAWHQLESPQISINQVVQHSRKLRRGTHVANHFDITLRDFSGDFDEFEQRWQGVVQRGVPNYFGAQRFGHNGGNVHRAAAAFKQAKLPRQRHQRSLLLSAARSFLFNRVLSARLADETWLQVFPDEPLNLQGTSQFFTATDVTPEQARVDSNDVHTSGPLWGEPTKRKGQQLPITSQLAEFEAELMSEQAGLADGLLVAGLEADRRPLRLLLQDASWQSPSRQQGSDLRLQFSLAKGQYATMVLRELVATD